MAKMFYTLDETKSALGRNEEGIKQLAREGRLREFRDGPRLMFKADQVEALKAELGGGEAINLAGDTGAGLSLQAGESRSGSGSGAGIPLADSQGGLPSPTKGDTAMDMLGGSGLGLSGSASGIPSPGKVAPPSGVGSGIGSGIGTGMQSGSGLLNLGGSGAGSGITGSGVSSGGTRGGITIFDVDESQRVDPSAQTAINSGVQDQINLEGVGSGSGLLDLTRESDDTSLGAVFDELSPGQAAGGPRRAPAAGISSMETQAGSSDIGPAIIDRGTRVVERVYVEKADPLDSALGGAALAASLVLLFGGFILISVLLGARPDILTTLRYENGQFTTYFLLVVGITLVFAVIGFIIGKTGTKNA